ncbi:hypothetical protein CCP4SC76_810013 [Gammaproteobacteria bacterium]
MKFSFAAIPAAFEVFRAGKEMNHAAAWKNAQLIGNILIAGTTLSRALGVDLHIPDDQLIAFAGGAAAIVNGILTVTTSSKVGLPVSESTEAKPSALPPLNPQGRSDLPDLS